MKVFTLTYSIFLFLSYQVSPVFAIAPDVNATKFELREKKKHRVDTFDFTEVYPNLENIDIDAKKKKCVELTLSGEFPVLETITYEMLFGELKGKLTGKFPKLKEINVTCVSTNMELDLNGVKSQSCTINVITGKEDIVLKLPKDVGIVLNTKVGLKGKVRAVGFKKKGRFGILNKTYTNELADTAEIVLTLNLETVEGKITIE